VKILSKRYPLNSAFEFVHFVSDEALTCNVCDRSFSSPRQLAHHQQKKRHFG